MRTTTLYLTLENVSTCSLQEQMSPLLVRLFVCLFVCLFVDLLICLFVCLFNVCAFLKIVVHFPQNIEPMF